MVDVQSSLAQHPEMHIFYLQDLLMTFQSLRASYPMNILKTLKGKTKIAQTNFTICYETNICLAPLMGQKTIKEYQTSLLQITEMSFLQKLELTWSSCTNQG